MVGEHDGYVAESASRFIMHACCIAGLVSGFGMCNTTLSSHHHPTLISQQNFQHGSSQKPTKSKTHGQAPDYRNHSNGPTYGDPKESGHDVSTGSTYYPAVGNEKLYEAYNDLHSLAQDFHKPFDAPAIVVVGHQTDGKRFSVCQIQTLGPILFKLLVFGTLQALIVSLQCLLVCAHVYVYVLITYTNFW